MRPPLLRPPSRIPNIRPPNQHAERNNLKEKPAPAPATSLLLDRLPLILPTHTSPRTPRTAITPPLRIIQILRRHTNNTMIITQLPRLPTKPQIRHRRNRRRFIRLKAQLLLFLILILQLQLQTLILEIRQFRLRSHIRIPNSSRRAAHEFVVFVVGFLPVADHGHDVREDGAGLVVLVGVEEDSETFQTVGAAEDVAACCALLGEPHCEAVAVEGAGAVDFEFEFDLFVLSCEFMLWQEGRCRWSGKGDKPPSSLLLAGPVRISILLVRAGRK
jgi:hypothetical protein